MGIARLHPSADSKVPEAARYNFVERLTAQMGILAPVVGFFTLDPQFFFRGRLSRVILGAKTDRDVLPRFRDGPIGRDSRPRSSQTYPRTAGLIPNADVADRQWVNASALGIRNKIAKVSRGRPVRFPRRIVVGVRRGTTTAVYQVAMNGTQCEVLETCISMK